MKRRMPTAILLLLGWIPAASAAPFYEVRHAAYGCVDPHASLSLSSRFGHSHPFGWTQQVRQAGRCFLLTPKMRLEVLQRATGVALVRRVPPHVGEPPIYVVSSDIRAADTPVIVRRQRLHGRAATKSLPEIAAAPVTQAPATPAQAPGQAAPPVAAAPVEKTDPVPAPAPSAASPAASPAERQPTAAAVAPPPAPAASAPVPVPTPSAPATPPAAIDAPAAAPLPPSTPAVPAAGDAPTKAPDAPIAVPAPAPTTQATAPIPAPAVTTPTAEPVPPAASSSAPATPAPPVATPSAPAPVAATASGWPPQDRQAKTTHASRAWLFSVLVTLLLLAFVLAAFVVARRRRHFAHVEDAGWPPNENDTIVAPVSKHGADPDATLTPQEFRKICAAELERAGWATQLGFNGGGPGPDIVGHRADALLAVRCRLSRTAITGEMVDEAAEMGKRHDAAMTALVSNAPFSQRARDEAFRHRVHLLRDTELAVFIS